MGNMCSCCGDDKNNQNGGKQAGGYHKMDEQEKSSSGGGGNTGGQGGGGQGGQGQDANRQQPKTPSTMHDFIILNDRANSFSVAGKQKPAEQMYRPALEGLQSLQAYDQVGICTGNLAVCLKRQRRFEEAEVLFKEALKLTEEYLGPSSPKVSDVSYNLHSMYKTQKRYPEAIIYLKKSIEIDERQYGAQHKEVLRSKSELEQLEQLAASASSQPSPQII